MSILITLGLPGGIAGLIRRLTRVDPFPVGYIVSGECEGNDPTEQDHASG